MRLIRNENEAGWVLLETVVLGMIVVAIVAAVGIFARTALLAEHSAARMEAALLVRARLSIMEAELDLGTLPSGAEDVIVSNNVSYRMDTSVMRQGDFYDVHIRVSWQILGRDEQADFVRRMRRHERAEKQS